MDQRPHASTRLDGSSQFDEHQKIGFIERHLLESRMLLVTGPITDELAQDCASRLFVMERMDRDRPITVLINSPGGSADSGFAIYDMLRFVRPPIQTVVNGLCASAGILVHLAAERGNRFAMPESRFMIHQPSTAGQGTASDLDITAREVIKLRERYISIIAAATERDPERVLSDARRDFWLNSKEALDYHLIDRIVSSRDDLPEA
ncbi:MAG: ATP-dependent Clp protease proteolytic subunit [Planctomycetes bacterium]|nr:ATP-dependent Clp protease proteolytic subunit [Planctomycetota bacterium]